MTVRQLYHRSTESFQLRMRLQQQRSASDTQPTCRSAGFEGRPLHPILYLSYLIVFPFNELRLELRLPLSIGIGDDGLEKHEDVVGLSRSFVRSAERTTAGFRA